MFKFFVIITSVILFSACGDAGDAQLKTKAKSESTAGNSSESGMSNSLGVGPVKSVTVGELDPAMAKEGETIFNTNCVACHKLDTKLVGPALNGVTKRQKPEWIMNMILNPDEMVKKDPDAKKLLAEYIAPMANLHLTEDQARKLLEYFRQNDSK